MRKDYAPEGFGTITPFLMVSGADEVLDFVKTAFDAEEKTVLRHDNGSLWHAQVKIGESMFLLGDAMGEEDHVMPAALYLYVPDTDKLYKKALEAGAQSIMEPADQFYGDRNAGVRDAGGNVWWIATKKEDLSPEEMIERGRAWEKGHPVITGEANS